MYAADIAKMRQMDADRLLTKLFGPKYDLLYLPEYDRQVSDEDLYRLFRDSIKLDYKTIMADEGLFHRDQDYMNMLVTVGDTWRYLPFVLAWTDAEAHVTFSHRELVPYGVKDRSHEQGHGVLKGGSEHAVDILVEDSSRNYLLNLVRLKY